MDLWGDGQGLGGVAGIAAWNLLLCTLPRTLYEGNYCLIDVIIALHEHCGDVLLRLPSGLLDSINHLPGGQPFTAASSSILCALFASC